MPYIPKKYFNTIIISKITYYNALDRIPCLTHPKFLDQSRIELLPPNAYGV